MSQTTPDSVSAWATPKIDRDQITRAVRDALKLQASCNGNVARVSDTLVVKYGEQVHLWEARNMAFAASTPSVRVPKVHDVWEVDDYTPKRRIGNDDLYCDRVRK
jgi:hypothetical protein